MISEKEDELYMLHMNVEALKLMGVLGKALAYSRMFHDAAHTV